MRSLVLLTLALVFSSYAQADLKMSADSPTMDQVRAVKEKIGPALMIMKDLNGHAITACEATTGEPFASMPQEKVDQSEFQLCMAVYASNEAAANALKTLIPFGTKVDGVYIAVEFMAEATGF